ncbi:MAG: hypothetical protein GF313_11860 [Caldithrix sp.]|nr:hypothetical protein [Caldithrix sp.]
MKINIQNIENNFLEVTEEIRSDFLNEEIHPFYPENLTVHVIVDKFDNDYRVDIDVQTNAHYECHRCLNAFEQPFHESIRQLYQAGSGQLSEGDDEVIEIPANATEIDLNPIIAEIIQLHHPIKMICKVECEGICPSCGANLNEETCQCDTETIDPRWEELRKFIK